MESFIHKLNLRDQATTVKTREWRKRNKGLTPNWVAKGNKIRSSGKVARIMVAISYQKGVIMCKVFEKMNGRYFSHFVRLNFRQIVHVSVNPNSRYFCKSLRPKTKFKSEHRD